MAASIKKNQFTLQIVFCLYSRTKQKRICDHVPKKMSLEYNFLCLISFTSDHLSKVVRGLQEEAEERGDPGGVRIGVHPLVLTKAEADGF